MKTTEINPIIDNARFTGFHGMVVLLCALLLIFDGYDLFIYGVVLPVLMSEWGLTPVQAGALGSYARSPIRSPATPTCSAPWPTALAARRALPSASCCSAHPPS